MKCENDILGKIGIVSHEDILISAGMMYVFICFLTDKDTFVRRKNYGMFFSIGC